MSGHDTKSMTGDHERDARRRVEAVASSRPSRFASRQQSSMLRRSVFYAVLILLLAAGLRFYHIDHQSFWNDEGNSARLSERSVQLIIEGTASDVHPPAYYLLLRGARELIGESELALRSISALAGLLTVAGTISIAKLFLPNGVVLLVGLLTACSPALLYYSQEARMYSLLSTLAVLSTFVLFRWLSSFKTGSPNFSNSLFPFTFALLTTFGLYTHYVYPAILLTQGFIVILFVTIWLSRADGRSNVRPVWRGGLEILTSAVVALILYAPWMPIFLRTGSSTREAGNATVLDFFNRALEWIIAGPYPGRLALENSGSLVVLCFFVLLVVCLSLFKFDWVGSALILWLYVTPAMMFLVGSTDDNYLKFLTSIIPAFWLLVGYGIVQITAKLPRSVDRLLTPTLLLFPLLALLPTLRGLYFDPATYRADYRGMAHQISAEDFPNAGIILNAPNQWEVFTYYYDGPAIVYPLPKQREPSDKIEGDVYDLLAEHERLYALFWGFQGFDPERTVERTLDVNAFKAIDEFRGDVRFVSYAVPTEPAQAPERRPDLRFAESGIGLDGFALAEETLKPGEIVQVTFFWRGDGMLERRYKLFLHILNGDGVLVAQRDSEPVGNLKPTDTWGVGETIIDNHGVLLPAELPPGEYQLYFGWYDLANPSARMPIQVGESGETVDAYLLAELQVK